MKIAVASDIHLEFAPLEFENPEGAEVLILAGDICVAKDLRDHDPHGILEGTRSHKFHNFFRSCSYNFNHVVYVAGNHEHYDGDFQKTYNHLKDKLGYLENIHVLDKETFSHQGITFVGSSLWTDMNKCDPLTLFHVKSMMSDYKYIKNSAKKVYRTVPLYKKDEDGVYLLDDRGNYIQCGTKKKESDALLSPEDTVVEHRKCLEYIRQVCINVREQGSNGNRVVVVGHHTPSFQSMDDCYKHDTIMNGAYHSRLEEFITDHSEIVMWVHGHVHDEHDYEIGDCRVVCNPRGYVGYETRAKHFTLKVFDI